MLKKIEQQNVSIDPNKLVRAEEHINAFQYPDKKDSEDPDEKGSEGIFDSYERYSRIKPVYFIERVIEGEKVNAVIDGWKFVEFAKSKNLDLIPACKLTIDNDLDVATIAIQLQNSKHNSYQERYKMIMNLWPFYYRKGKKNLEQPIETTSDGKKLNIYDKIGRELFLSPTTVKHLHKIGEVNPLYFERLEKNKISLTAAYLACVGEEKNAEPGVPAVKAPVYVSSTTAVPVFSESSSTDVPVAPVSETDTTENNETEKAAKTPVANNDEFITVRGICQCCGKETEIKINKNQL